ncbi:MAG: hypothetical protein K1X28_10970 [Parachlamydiales bacterium]|nr:hypothetical protein [Parachlamydiales bacterium]
MLKWLLFIPFAAFCGPSSMLAEADAIAQKYSLETAKALPPSPSPEPLGCLGAASVWFTIDLSMVEAPAFEHLAQAKLWDILREIGVQGVYLKGLKQGGEYRTGIAIDPKWGDGWDLLSQNLQKKGMTLIGDSLGKATGITPDFAMALKNTEGYRGLYHLVEIEPRDWPKLPNTGKLFANVPWLTLQTLHKKGYVPEQFAPYVKESSWNATGPIKCVDGKERRWIYLKENKEDPVINWLGPSFAGYRIAAGDLLDSIYNLGQKISVFDGDAAQETLLLWTRKLGGYSVLETDGGICDWMESSADMLVDSFTRPALLHAMIAEDAEALKLIYRIILESGIESKRLVHELQPFDHFACDYSAISSKKQFQYYEEILTGDALKNRLLKEDAAKLRGKDPVTWPTICMTRTANRDHVFNAHLLLALFYAMQPGAFSFSVSDLLGLTSNEKANLLCPNEGSLYGSLTSQMKNSCSFASRLKQIIMARINSGIESAELTAVPSTNQKGLLILIHRMKGSLMTQLTAINFGSSEAKEILDLPGIRQTSAIDLMTGLAEKKPLDSSVFQLVLPPLSGKVILFQPKYFD